MERRLVAIAVCQFSALARAVWTCSASGSLPSEASQPKQISLEILEGAVPSFEAPMTWTWVRVTCFSPSDISTSLGGSEKASSMCGKATYL